MLIKDEMLATAIQRSLHKQNQEHIKSHKHQY